MLKSGFKIMFLFFKWLYFDDKIWDKDRQGGLKMDYYLLGN